MNIRFGKKKKAALIFIIISLTITSCISLYALPFLFSLYVSAILILLIFLFTNKRIKNTNWWKNQFIYTHQFISNLGYRTNLTRNIEIVNIGSTPARFAFDYSGLINGANWSTGNQGLDMDYQILRFYHSFMKEGATVLLPIVPFSSVSAYLIPSIYKNKTYMVKFYSILDYLQTKYLPQFKYVNYWYKYPLFFNWKVIKYLIKDTQEDKSLFSTTTLKNQDNYKNADFWMDICWKTEFKISNFEQPLPSHLQQARSKSILLMQEILDFLIERGYKPVFIMPPISLSLAKRYTPNFREVYINSFIREFKKYKIPFLDYTKSIELQKDEYFCNDLFMNPKGRKIFTKQVLQDLNLIK